MWSFSPTGTVNSGVSVLGTRLFSFAVFGGLNLSERLQNLIRTGIDPDRRNVAVTNHTAFIDNEQCAFGESVAVQVSAVFFRNFAFRLEIRQESHFITATFTKRLMTKHAVNRDAEQICVQ